MADVVESKVPIPGTSKALDTCAVQSEVGIVEREMVTIGDAANHDARATVCDCDPAFTEQHFGLFVRQLTEENALTQVLIQQVGNILAKVYGLTAAAGTPVLNVNAIGSNQSMNLAQWAGTAPSAPIATLLGPTNAQIAPVVHISPGVPMPIVPQHIYGNITV